MEVRAFFIVSVIVALGKEDPDLRQANISAGSNRDFIDIRGKSVFRSGKKISDRNKEEAATGFRRRILEAGRRGYEGA